MTQFGFLGLGAMGSRMAGRLLAAGHGVRAWNRTAETAAPLAATGATIGATPRDAASGADLVVAMVRDDDASRAVWLDGETGALAGMPNGAIAIDCSTLSVGWARDLAATCRDHGIAFVDAPVAGSRPQAEAGQLIFFAGGDTAAVDQARPLFEATGGAVHHCGGAGSGAAVKLMVNALFAVQLAAVAELIGLARRTGVDVQTAIEVVAATPVCSPAAQAAADAMLSRRFAPLFPVALVEKDLTYAADTNTPMIAAARDIYAGARAAGYGDDNITGIVQLYD